jgi:protein-disulfide isomerase
MHDVLFTHPHALDDPYLIQYDIALGLEPTQFRYALVVHAYEGRRREDFTNGIQSGVNGTPTFFIENIRYDGSRDCETFLASSKAWPRGKSDEVHAPGTAKFCDEGSGRGGLSHFLPL